jgi:5-methylcytosine-specific restriction endonuclease McrA
MSSNSERVKRWRRNTKQRMIDAMGGCCQICGYNRCPEALTFHHINPSEKAHKFGGMRANPKNWLTICEELRKCVLLCANCHHEFHADVIELPKTYAVFNEAYVDYKNLK